MRSMGTDVYGCIVRDAYQVLTLDVALMMPGEVTGLPSPWFPATKTFGFMLVLDLIKNSDDGGRTSELERSPLADAISRLPHLAAAYYRPDVKQCDGDMEELVVRHAAEFIGDVRVGGGENIPMSEAEWRRAFDVGQPFISFHPMTPPKKLARTLGKRWEQAFGALPRARYTIQLLDVTWLRAIKKDTWFTSRAYAP